MDGAPPNPAANVKYWLQDHAIRNFGDYLSDYFLDRLFLQIVPPDETVRIVGSCIDDMFMPPGERVVFWGCGLREENGLGAMSREAATLLSVRGPLTRSALRLGATIPIGDPGLLLPFLHQPARMRTSTTRTVLIPHFHDQRSDADLQALSGCNTILRPNIPAGLNEIDAFLDVVASAAFVLGASMHGVIAAASYGRPFGFWDSGAIDLPFKWRDLAASLQIPCVFHTELGPAQAHYEATVAPVLTIPPLGPMLAVAPFPVRPDVLIRVIEADIARHGLAVFGEYGAASNTGSMLAGAASRLGRAWLERDQLRAELTRLETTLQEHTAAAFADADALRASLGSAREQVARAEASLAAEQLAREDAHRAASAAAAQMAAYAAEAVRRDDEDERRQTELALLTEALDRAQKHAGALQSTVRLQSIELAQRPQEQQALHAAEAALQHEIAVHASVQAALERLHAEHQRVIRSMSWALTSPLRRLAQRFPHGFAIGRRAAKAVWLVATMRLMDWIRLKRLRAAEIPALQGHFLFDTDYYHSHPAASAVPEAELVAHYVWVGAAQGLNPHPLFDGAWYAAHAPEFARSGMSPLLHYIRTGAAAGRDPHPLFDTPYYLTTGPAPAPGVTPLEDYLRQPRTAGRRPNRLFDPAGYRYEHMAGQPGDPLIHYVTDGEARYLDPSPTFDAGWYAKVYQNRDGLTPLAFHIRGGAPQDAPTFALARLLPGLPFPAPNLAFPETVAPDVSIIIPGYGHYAQTYRCLLSVMVNTGSKVAYEVILADDRPDASTAHLFDGVAGLHVHVNPQNLGFLLSCNRAARMARGTHIVFLNNDTIVGVDWLAPLLRCVEDPTVGMVGCKLLNADGSIQEAGGSILSNGWGKPYGSGDDPGKGEYNFVREVDVVTGACFLVRRSAFEAVGGFDERYTPAFYEEFDLAIALRDIGYRTLYQPASHVTHLGSASYGAETRDRQSLKNHAQFVAKWRRLIATQPDPLDTEFVQRERAAPRGVVLVIDDRVPEYDKNAGAVTLFQYLGLLQGLGLKVIYHPFDGAVRQPYTSVLQQQGIEILHAPDTLSGWLDRNGKHVDHIWVARPDVATPTLDLLKRKTGARILYYTHDLHYLREMRRYQLDGDAWARSESLRLKPLELAIFAAVDRVMTPSDEEARIIREEVPTAHVTVIPPYLFPSDGPLDAARLDFSGRNTLIFVGGFNHVPNVDAAVWLAQEIMPEVWRERADIRLLIVGNGPPPEVTALANDRVEVTGFVPDLAPYYARARVAVSPLRYGAGVKGKIVGSLQAGVPVVTTPCGNEGIRLRDGVEAFIGETPGAIAQAILALCNDEALCRAMAVAGAAVLDRQFSEHRARAVMLTLLGNDLCPVCGARPRVEQYNVSGQDVIACTACTSSPATMALADIMLRPYRRQYLSSVQQAQQAFSRLRIHAIGATGSIGPLLRQAPSFSESALAAPEGDSIFDLILGHAASRDGETKAWPLAAIYRSLRQGGRFITGVPGEVAEPEANFADQLRRAGFMVELHRIGESETAALVYEATRPVAQALA